MSFKGLKYPKFLCLSVFFALLSACGGDSATKNITVKGSVFGLSESSKLIIRSPESVGFSDLTLSENGQFSVKGQAKAKTKYKNGDSYEIYIAVNSAISGNYINICTPDKTVGVVSNNTITVNISCDAVEYDGVYSPQGSNVIELYKVQENGLYSLYFQDTSKNTIYLSSLDSDFEIKYMLGGDQLFLYEITDSGFWVSNGTESGTREVLMSPEVLIYSGNKIFYTEALSATYNELYVIDKVNLAPDLLNKANTGSEFYGVDNVSIVKDSLIFTAQDSDGTYWVYLIDVDGVVNQTNHVPNYHETVGDVDGWIHFRDCYGAYRTDGKTKDNDGRIVVENTDDDPMNCEF